MTDKFPEPKFLGDRVKVELNLFNCATKQILKTQQVLIHRILVKKSDLSNLNSNGDKLDIDKLKNVPTGFRQFEK